MEMAETATPNLQRKDGTVPAEDAVRRILREAIKAKDRAAIARAMSQDLGRTVTASMLADFTRNGAGKRQVRFPAAWVKAFCRAVDNDDLARSQLREHRQRALALGDLLLPWVLERAKAKRTMKR